MKEKDNMNKKELLIYLEKYTIYKKDMNDSTEYFTVRNYHEYNGLPYKIFDIIETLYNFNNSVDKIIEVLKIYDLYE